MSVPGADTRFKVFSRTAIAGDPTAPTANEQVWLYRRAMEWTEAEGPRRVPAMVMQIARWIAERSEADGAGAIIPAADAERLYAEQLAGREPVYTGAGVPPAPELAAPESVDRLQELETKVASQDAKLDLILSLLAASKE